MRRQLFTDCSPEQQLLEIALYHVNSPKQPGSVGNAACFVIGNDAEPGLRGFAEVMIRSHAEGCWEKTAGGDLGVAHLEAWWVDETARGGGAGRELVRACGDWALAQGLTLLASDAELENVESQAAHVSLGFVEVERAVHFVKSLS